MECEMYPEEFQLSQSNVFDTIMKTNLFKYIENFTSKKLKIFR